jgi:hypothetical protein
MEFVCLSHNVGNCQSTLRNIPEERRSQGTCLLTDTFGYGLQESDFLTRRANFNSRAYFNFPEILFVVQE